MRTKKLKILLIIAIITSMLVPTMEIISHIFGIKWGNVIGGLVFNIHYICTYATPLLIIFSLIICFKINKK